MKKIKLSFQIEEIENGYLVVIVNKDESIRYVDDEKLIHVYAESEEKCLDVIKSKLKEGSNENI